LSSKADGPSSLSQFTFRQKCILTLLPWPSALLFRFLYFTTKKTFLNEEIWRKVVRKENYCVVATWHENVAIPAAVIENPGFTALVSQSFDGELATRTLAKFGVETVRGSSSRGGFKALGELLTELKKNRIIGITVDGPRGPRRKAKPGVAMISAQSDLPILPIAAVNTRSKRLSSWDRMPIPLPFSHTVVKFGDLILPAESSARSSIIDKTRELEASLNALQKELETEYNVASEMTTSS